MRTFPRAVRRRLGVVALAVSLALGVAAVPTAQAELAGLSSGVSAGDKLKERQKRVKKQLAHAHEAYEMSTKRAVRAAEALEAARAELRSARSHLFATRDRLDAAHAKDLEMQAALVEAQTELGYAELEHDVGTVEVSHQRDEVAGIIADIYRQGDPDLNAFTSLLNAQSPSDLVLTREGERAIVGTQTQVYDDLTAAEVLLKVREQEVGAARDAVAEKAKEAAAHVKVVAGLEAEAQAAKDDVVRLVDARKSAKGEAQKAKKKDLKQLRAQKRENERVEALLKERARKARLRALRQARANQDAGPSGGFLTRPVPGVVTSGFGMRVHPIYGYYALHNGTDFGVSCGEPMYAAADGRVVGKYYQTAYGNRLLIDNGFQRGVGLATIYNHASSYTVSVGDRVSRGQVVGYVGNTGWSTGCHLHFTVMVNGSAVDPMNWL